MQILLINLKRRHDRLAVMQERLAGMKFDRIDAVDGRQWKPKSPPQQTLYPLSKSELACIESHKLACQFIIDAGLPRACVLEDDVVLSPDFKSFITDDSWIPSDVGLIKIETLKSRIWLSTRAWPARERKLHQLHSYHAGGAGYIISLERAKDLFGFLEAPDQAFDDIIFSRTLKEPAFEPVMQLDPALCAQEFVLSTDYSKSDISAERVEIRTKRNDKPDWTSKMWRELKRPFIRALEKLHRRGQDSRKVDFQ